MSASAPTVAILTLGCKLNQADSQALARSLLARGFRVVDRPLRQADAFVINTCSVTHVADRKARHLARLARRLSPAAAVVLTGCYAETAPAGLAAASGADLVVPNRQKGSIPAWLAERLGAGDEPAAGRPRRPGLRTRALIKIQEGCNDLCSFCIVPRTRGRERSVPIEEVVAEVRAREAEGVQEVVLTGTQLGNYGRDLGWREPGPRPLLEALLERTSLPRIRLSSLQAQDISPGLLRLWDDPRLCRHFHLPLQSGSNAVLARMRRRYTAQGFRRAVELIRERLPEAAITTDVIVGFPGEGEEDFAATYRLCREIGFAGIHVFPYSRRPGTAATLMPDQVPPPLRRARLERLLELARHSAREFRCRYLGRTMLVLWEGEKGGRWQGLTDNYIRVYTSAADDGVARGDLTNRLLPARLLDLEGDGVLGRLEPGGGPRS